tara:strand:+ start:2288 stop:3442 length:1155 start_codon:yes stop_codon:yes gene_type:complete
MIKKHYLLDITISDETSIWSNGKKKLDVGSFSLKEDGYFFGRSKSWYPDEDELNLLNIITSDKAIDLQDKKIYRYPNLELPRQKVDLLKTKFNVKIIRDAKLADIYIVSDKLILSLLTLDWGKSLTYAQMFEVFNMLKQNDQLTESGLDKCKEFLSIVEKEDSIRINVVKDYRYTSPVADDIATKVSDFDHDGSRDMVVRDGNVALYDQLRNTTALIVKDVEINKIISEDLAVITEDQFDQLCKMITSSDKDNRTLAVEMLANCNVEESFDIVSYLFYWHYDYWKDSKNWNSINVKTLRTRLEKFSGGKDNNRQWAYDQYIKLLEAENKLTDFIVKKTIQKMYDSVIKNTFGCKNNVFAIDLESIYLVDKYKNLIIKKEECTQI